MRYNKAPLLGRFLGLGKRPKKRQGMVRIEASALVVVLLFAGAGNAAAKTTSTSWQFLGEDECARWIQNQRTLKNHLGRCRADFGTLRTVNDEIRFASAGRYPYLYHDPLFDGHEIAKNTLRPWPDPVLCCRWCCFFSTCSAARVLQVPIPGRDWVDQPGLDVPRRKICRMGEEARSPPLPSAERRQGRRTKHGMRRLLFLQWHRRPDSPS